MLMVTLLVKNNGYFILILILSFLCVSFDVVLPTFLSATLVSCEPFHFAVMQPFLVLCFCHVVCLTAGVLQF